MSYLQLATRTVNAFRGATPQQLAARVEWTNLWTARQVLIHIDNVAERAARGQTRPLPDAETHEAVMRRDASESLEQLCSSLLRFAPQVPEVPMGPSSEWDLAVHLTDVLETWGEPQLERHLWWPVLDATMRFLVETQQLRAQVQTDTTSWGDGHQVAAVDEYALFRALFARRDLATVIPNKADAGELKDCIFFA